MPRTVVALFDHIGSAQRAEQTLASANLLGEHIVLASSPLRSALAGEGVPVEPTEGPHMREGDVATALEEQGVPRERAEFYAEAIRRGGAAVVLREVRDEDAERTAQILLEHRPIDPTRRLSAYHELGYAGYNPAASPFSADEAAAERNQFADEHHGDVDVIFVM